MSVCVLKVYTKEREKNKIKTITTIFVLFVFDCIFINLYVCVCVKKRKFITLCLEKD